MHQSHSSLRTISHLPCFGFAVFFFFLSSSFILWNSSLPYIRRLFFPIHFFSPLLSVISFILIRFFFRQTDLCGIRWRKFVHSEATNDPLSDPILRSYARCLQVNILSVWRRIPTKKNDPYQSHMFEHRTSNTITYPPLSLKTSKELWIFWYGEEPDWSELLVPELVKNTGKY